MSNNLIRFSKCYIAALWCFKQVLFILLMTAHVHVDGQNNIPLGVWRAHLSFNTIHSIALSEEKVFAASQQALMILQRNDNTIATYSTLNGLSSASITVINFNHSTNQLLIGYESGIIDIIRDGEVISLDPSVHASLTGPKKVNGITFNGSTAYIATDYGVVVLDLLQQQIKETWRDLGPQGKQLRINQSVIEDNKIFLATESGILVGLLGNNLLDFNNWQRFDQEALETDVRHMALFNGLVYAAIDGGGVYAFQQELWQQQGFLQNKHFTSFSSSSNHLLMADSTTIWLLSDAGNVEAVKTLSNLIPLDAIEEVDGVIWIGDNRKGLVSWKNENMISFLANGPSTATVRRLEYLNGKIYQLSGGYSENMKPLHQEGLLDVFSNGMWESMSTSVSNITDVDAGSDGSLFIASFKNGVEHQARGETILYDETNSTLVNSDQSTRAVYVTALDTYSNELWVLNYNSATSVHKLANDIWQSYSFPVAAAKYPLDLVVDPSDVVWIVLDPQHGGGLLAFNIKNGTHAYLTDQVGAGELPSRSVHSITVDRDGYVWVGTDTGVAYFFDYKTDAIRPIYQSRFLLKDDKVTAIAVDGGNRKWIGTERGVWLFDATGSALIYNFTSENSPLISNVIIDIEIDPVTGEVFFATDKGVVSFRSNATESNETFKDVKIFPNPITHNFSGTVGITGLSMDAYVKITDIAGKLIWQTQANGGTATWDVHDYGGRRVATGVYIVFAATGDGAETVVGKVAVID